MSGRAERGRMAGSRVWRGVLAAVPVTALALAAGAAAQQPTPLLDACDRLGAETAPLYLDRLRIAELQGRLTPGPWPVQRSGTRRLRCAAEEPGLGSRAGTQVGGLRLEILPLHAALEHRTQYAGESLNGLRWGSRGYSAQLQGGFAASWGPVSAAFAPAFAYAGNADFEIQPVSTPSISPYAWYWRPGNIDWPQRFGPDPFWWTHPGESYVRLDAFGAAVGFSTESLRWGHARRNPLLMSGGAPGFPHVFAGTSRPVDLWIARLAVEAVWGHLAESDYFDSDPDNDRRLFAGLVLALEPRGVPGLEIGATRALLTTIPPGGLDLAGYLIDPYANVRDNPRGGGLAADNQLLSIFARWVFPEAELEVYGEFARDDHWDGTRDFFQEPEHSGAITAGLQKLVAVGDSARGHRLRIAAEATSLNFSETQRSGRPEVIFYTHSGVRQGYTHRGQLLGAPIGPSSDAQSLEIDFLARRWLAGLVLERVRYANDIYWQAHADRYTTFGHDVELSGALRGAFVAPAPGLELSGAFEWSGRYNRDFIAPTFSTYRTSWDQNVSVQLGASWRPAWGRTGDAARPPSPPARP